jgi:hypothetical protein
MFVTIPKNYILYKSVLNKYVREGLLVHSKDCNRMAWFSDTYKKANYYRKKQKDATVYAYRTRKNLKLFNANSYFNFVNFKTYVYESNIDKLKCITDINLQDIALKYQGNFSKYTYLKLNKAERVIYEYMFCFGFMNVIEQYNFSKLIIKLQEYGLIEPIQNIREEKYSKLSFKIFRTLYDVYGKILKDNYHRNRFSILAIDKNVLYNICALFNIDGYIYNHQGSSIWHSMDDLKEIVVFKPGDNIV